MGDSSVTPFSLRLADVALEDCAERQPLAGLFLGLTDAPLADALRPLLPLLPRNGSIRKEAGLQQVQGKARRARAKYPNLTQDQAVCVVLYTTEEPDREQSVYYGLNAALRSPSRSNMRDWRDYTWLLLGGLVRLPPHRVERVLRGVARPLAALGRGYTVGAVLQWASFSSAAVGAVNVMQDFIGNSGERTIFQVELCEGTGRDLREFSFFPNEAELLLPPNLCVRVKKIQHDFLGSTGLTLVELQQERTQDMIADLDPTITPAKELKRLLGTWWPSPEEVATAVRSAHDAGMGAHGGPPAMLLAQAEELLGKRLGVEKMDVVQLVHTLNEYTAAAGVVIAVLKRLITLCGLCDDAEMQNRMAFCFSGHSFNLVPIGPSLVPGPLRPAWLSISQEHQEQAVTAGVLSAVVEAARAHGTCEFSQAKALRAFGIICHGKGPAALARKQLAAEAQALTVVIAAMTAHPQSAHVQYEGCCALVSICGGIDAPSSVRKQMAVDEGAFTVITMAMHTHNGGRFPDFDRVVTRSRVAAQMSSSMLAHGLGRPPFNEFHADAVLVCRVLCEGVDAAVRQQALLGAGALQSIFSAYADTLDVCSNMTDDGH